MKDDLLNYMEKRFSQGQMRFEQVPTRSFVTISRQCGCFGSSIAKVLIEDLKAHQKDSKVTWDILNKDIIETSAKALSVDRKRIQEIFDLQQESVLENFLGALTPNASMSDLKIRKTIKEVIQSFAIRGGHIFIGRGTVLITKDIPNGIHVRVEASLDWRVEQVANRMHLTTNEARKKVLEIDRKRELFKDYFKKRKDEYIQYDLVLNNERINVYEASQLIMELMKLRHHI